MTQADLLRHLVEALEALDAEYMIGGSHAGMYYGEPRLTRDIDVIVDLHLDHLRPLLAYFPAETFYVEEAAAREAIETRGQCNIVHPASGLKIDVYVNPVESAMHARDVLGILRVSGPELDERYIAQWADQLGVRTLWDRIRKQAQ